MYGNNVRVSGLLKNRLFYELPLTTISSAAVSSVKLYNQAMVTIVTLVAMVTIVTLVAMVTIVTLVAIVTIVTKTMVAMVTIVTMTMVAMVTMLH